MARGFLLLSDLLIPVTGQQILRGGSRFGYELLWVVTLGTVMLILIQNMAARLGIATGKSLAVNICEYFPKPVAAFLGLSVVLACIATDVAELLGGGIGFTLLFGFPLWIGVLLTLLIEVFLLISQRYHKIEKIIVGFLGIITLCYLFELLIVHPDSSVIAPKLVVPAIGKNSIYVALAILGALVMPHNIFLHSNVIHSRRWGVSEEEKRDLLRYEKIDTLFAMTLGWIVNSAMIIVAASVFFRNHIPVTTIEQASVTLKPLAGQFAGILFAIALVFSGISSSITVSMAEANIITGFLGKPEDPRTMLYRSALLVTAIPAVLIILFSVDTFRVLILSQVILSIQLPFTLIPLLILCRNSQVMGSFKSRTFEFAAASIISAIVIGLNIYFFYTTLTGGN